ncbi:hypothetical protein [Nocardia goodfellowii]|uniref:Uncharacterized protein n=1 Tax=Nocardia goodfellowii TaxID=882446 RepID=A0ABS4QPI8_9NOCA|nr:hypothetical protein [Nocardia goodfellowii]MBP2193013.1 hypothetical protein [Nocardia goodfellowii]
MPAAEGQAMRKRITIEFDEELTPEMYGDFISAIWMSARAFSSSRDLNFHVRHDGDSSLSHELNEQWDSYRDQAQW